jgi:hypothetical protein
MLFELKRIIHVMYPLSKEMYEELDLQELMMVKIIEDTIPWKTD